MAEADIGLKRPSTHPLAIVEQELILTGEADIGLRPDTLHPITQLALVHFWVSHFIIVLLKKMFLVTRELDIGLRPATITTII